MFLALSEAVDIVLMVLAGGFIFQSFLSREMFITIADHEHPEKEYDSKYGSRRQWWLAFKLACIIAASAIVLHEFGHKFAALFFGLDAVIRAPYFFLAIAVLLVLLRSPIIFFIGGYVSYGCNQLAPSASCVLAAGAASAQTAAVMQYYVPSSWSVMWIAFAGPLMNIAQFLLFWFVLSNKKTVKWLKKKGRHYIPMLIIAKQVNLFLFILNMLPIPGFDGWHFFSNLYTLLVH